MALLTDLRGKLKDYWKDKYDSRTGDGTTTIWKLSKAPLTSQVVTVGTSAYTEGNQYSIDKDTGIVTFLSGAPANGTGWVATYKYSTFSDNQLYTFLNNGINAVGDDIFNDVYTDIVGIKNLIHTDTCEATSAWVTAGGATNPTLGTGAKYGQYLLNLGCATTSGASGMYQNNQAATTDISGYDYVNLWLNVADINSLGNRKAVEIRVGNHSGVYYTYTWGTEQLKNNDWTHLSVNFADMSAVGSVSQSAIDYLAIALYLNTATGTTKALAVGDVKMDDWRYSSFPIESSNQLEYRLPKRWVHVNRMEAWDPTGYRGKMIQFETFGDKLRLDESWGDGTYYKMFGNQMFDTLYSSGSYTSDMPRVYDEMVVNHAAAEALESLLVDRTRYNAYSTTVGNQGASVGSLQNASMLYRGLFREAMKSKNNLLHGTEIAPSVRD